MVGVPLFIGFIPKLQFASAAFELTWQKWPVLLALAISTLLNVLYFLYTAMVLLAIGLVIGIHSAPLTTLLQQGFALFCQY